DQLPASDGRQIARFVRLGAVVNERLRLHAQLAEDGHSGLVAGTRYLVDGKDGLEPAGANAAVALGDGEAQGAGVAERADAVPGEFVGTVPAVRQGFQLFLGDGADELLEVALLGGQLKVHRVTVFLRRAFSNDAVGGERVEVGVREVQAL